MPRHAAQLTITTEDKMTSTQLNGGAARPVMENGKSVPTTVR